MVKMMNFIYLKKTFTSVGKHLHHLQLTSKHECKRTNDVDTFHQTGNCENANASCKKRQSKKSPTISSSCIMFYRKVHPVGTICRRLNITILPPYSKWPPMTTAAKNDDKSQLIYLSLLQIMRTHRLQLTQCSHIQHIQTPT